MGRGRLRTAAAVTALGALLGAGLVTAPAAVAAGTTGSGTVSATGSCRDGGGVRWDAKVVWGGVYTARSGKERVAITQASWTTDRTGPTPTDAAIRVVDGSRDVVQRLIASGTYDYRGGAVRFGVNPRDPLSAKRAARVVLSLGVDGDGERGCTVVLKQPRSTASGTPGATPTTGTPSAKPTGATPSATPTKSSGATRPSGSRASTAPSTTPSSGTSTSTASGLSQREADVLAATNTQRRNQSRAAFTVDACLTRYAKAHAQRQASERRMYHQDLGPILRACGARTVGENVAYGYSTGASVVNGWMNSDGHRRNILNASFTKIGIGAAQSSDGRWYWAQVFGG